MTTKPSSIELSVLDPHMPFEHRYQLLQHLLNDGSKPAMTAVKSLLDAAANSQGDALYQKKLQEIEEIKQQMLAGALRPATFFRLVSDEQVQQQQQPRSQRSRRGRRKSTDESPSNGSANGNEPSIGNAPQALKQRAHVLTEDGTSIYPLLPSPEFGQELACGDEVVVDGQGKMILFATGGYPDVGEEGRFERRIGRDRVEVSLRDVETVVYRAADRLVEELESGQAKPGDMLLVCPRRWMAFAAIPSDDKLSHYRYLCKQPVPDIDVQRDIGAPPAFIRELTEHVRMEMTQPELGAKYRLMRCRTKLLTGVSGSGKTLCIQGLWRSLYDVMSEVTGVPVENLPFRTLKLRAGSVLSKWFSESEKLLDKFFDEVEQIADERFVLDDGTEVPLPVLVICEEIDGLARARGSDHVNDRVQTTLLQRLDATSQKLRDQLILFLFTTNVPELIDPAFLRRAGGTVERFGRLSRRDCSEVLEKHLQELPLRIDGKTQANGEAVQRVKAEVLPWLFSSRDDEGGLVEITYVGATEPDVKHRRDFLTGALIARAVQDAAEQGRVSEWRGRAAGVATSHVTTAIADQIQSIVDQLHQHNVHQYVTLPEGARVASVRRLQQPQRLPSQLMRRS